MRIITAAVILSIFAASAADTNVVLATQYADGSTNLWSQTDLVDALGLMNRKYHRDMENETGRRQWHGQVIGEYLLTNDATQVIHVIKLYSDGYVHTNAPRRVGSSDPEAAAKAKAAAAARAEAMRAAWEAANLPPELAALRAAQRAAQTGTNVVTVTMEP